MAVSVAPSRTPYEQHREYVLGVLARKCSWLSAPDREAAFHDAYEVLLEKERDGELRADGMRPPQVRAYLVQTAVYKALDEGKRAERRRTGPLEDDGFYADEAAGPLDERPELDLDNARVREIVSELPERRQAIVKLRFFFDRPPVEIQRFLGITERVYRRELERALKHVAERYERVREGTFCETRRSLILAYVAGVAGPNRAQDARRHLADCPACRAWAVELREATRRAAALLPLPAMPFVAGRLERLGERAAAIREGVSDGLFSAKQHAAALVARGGDPGVPHYAAALRPGAVAVALTGCLAVGGGVTYCAVAGVPEPVRSLLSPDVAKLPKERHHKHDVAKAPARRAAVASATPARVPATQGAGPTAARANAAPATPSSSGGHARSSSAPKATAASRRKARARRSQHAATQEFGLEGSGTSGSSSGSPSATAASASGGGSSGTSSSSSSSSSSSGSSSGSSGSSSPPGEFDP